MEQSRKGLRAGWATVSITPDVPVPMGGYGARTESSAGVHDPLEARALSLSDGKAHAILIVADILQIDDEIVHSVRAGVSEVLAHDGPLLVWVAATHTHSGPEFGGLLKSPFDYEGVRLQLRRALIEVAIQAVVAEQLVTARWASGSVEGIAGNRDHPEEETEIGLDLLLLYQAGNEREPVAILGSLPVHPTVLGAENLLLSADLPGALRRSLSALAAPNTPWIALATGAAGDVSTRHTRTRQDFAELERLGDRLARRAWDLIGSAHPLFDQDESVELGWLSQHVQLSTKQFLREDELAEWEQNLRTAWSTARAEGNVSQARTVETALQGIDVARAVHDRPPVMQPRTEISALRVGSLALISVPGELYSIFGAQLRRATGGPVLVLGFTNGYIGYLPRAQAYAQTDYEVLATVWAVGSAERLTEEAVRHLHLLFATDSYLPSAYHHQISKRLAYIERYERGSVRLAGSWVAETISRGCMVYTLGTGHSSLLAEEIFSRASGLLPVQPIGSAPLALHENAVASSEWEKLPGVARILLEHSGIQPGDLLLVMSNSGRNAVPVEAAEWARERGIRTIALTSTRHSSSAPSLAPSGRRLIEVADLVLDNLGKPGDALVESANGLHVGASSTVLGAFILQSIVLAAVEELERRETPVPALRSMNVPGAQAVNEKTIVTYGGRLPYEYDQVRQHLRDEKLKSQRV
jgi:uncharacterized phosphosugar-binding protein